MFAIRQSGKFVARAVGSRRSTKNHASISECLTRGKARAVHFPQIHQRQATRDTLLARATVLELLRDRLRYRRYLFAALVAD